MRAWMPWVFLSVFVTAWGAGPIKAFLNGGPAGMAGYNQTGRPPAPHAVLSPAFDVPSLHRLVFRDYPVEATAVDRARIGDPAYRSTRAEAARFNFNWLSATGTAILGAALMTILYLRIPTGPGAADRRRDVPPHARAAHDHRLHAVARIRHPLRRHRRDARPGVHAHGRALSVLRGDARLARRGADRIGHELERALRQPAEDHGAAARPESRSSSRPPTPPAASWAR